jgi:hypothetical protein
LWLTAECSGTTPNPGFAGMSGRSGTYVRENFNLDPEDSLEERIRSVYERAGRTAGLRGRDLNRAMARSAHHSSRPCRGSRFDGLSVVRGCRGSLRWSASRSNSLKAAGSRPGDATPLLAAHAVKWRASRAASRGSVAPSLPPSDMDVTSDEGVGPCPRSLICQVSGWATSHPVGSACVPLGGRPRCRQVAVAVRLGAGIHQLALEVADAWAIRPEHSTDDRGRL